MTGRGQIPLRWVTGAAVAVGGAAAALWFYLAGGTVLLAAVAGLTPSAAVALATVSLGCVLLRFLRWHYMLRRAGVVVPIRPSLSFYVASLAGIATPAYIGEAARCALLRRAYGVQISRTLPLWVAERLLDFAAIAIWVIVGYWEAPGAIAGTAAVGAALIGLSQIVRSGSAVDRASAVFVPFALSLIAWLPAMFLLSIAAWGLEVELDAYDGFEILGLSLISGGVSLMPAGIGSMGGLAILQLEAAGIRLIDAVAVVAVVRVCTVGLTLGVGTALLIRLLFRSRRGAEASRSFDAIADYLGQFSPHIWGLLLERKTTRIREALGPPTAAGRGLDLGCGLGLQAAALRDAGYVVIGMDPAQRLLQQAVGRGVPGFAADALSIPVADEQLDFVYTVGVLHHLPSYSAQDAACREVRRVLKPGGVFIVMETNPRNPLFRLYMTYLFPLLRQIDEGIEVWLDDARWAETPGFRMESVGYFTFLPDFLPRWLLRAALPVERFLERSPLGRFSVHYMAVMRKTAS